MSNYEIKKGYKKTEVGIIPEDWACVFIDKVARRGSGHTPNKKISNYYNGGIKWVSLADTFRLDSRYIFDTEIEISNKGLKNSSAVLHPKNTVLVSRDAGVGKVAVMPENMAVSQHFITWFCSKNLFNWYLYYWLFSQKPYFETQAVGSTIKTLGLPFFNELKIPLPPIAEQEAIAEVLSDADALITSLDRLITKKRNIKQGTMQLLLTGKKRLPNFNGDWETKTLGEIGEFKNGINKGKDDFGFGFPFVNLMDVFGISKVFPNLKLGLVNSSATERKMYELKKGDVLFVRSSVKPEGVGLTSLITANLENTVYSGFLIRFTDNGKLNFEFKEHCFFEEGFRQRLIDSSTVSANTNINQEALKKLEIKLPPTKEEQKAIARILSEMDAEIEALEAQRDKYKALKQGMMQELLTGKTRLIK